MKKERLINDALAMKAHIINDRRFLHRHPGTSFDTKESLEYVKKELENMGYEPVECGKSGLVALAGKKKEGRVFLLRSDMDGLPISEESGEEFASTNGCMHACGHDMHTAMLLGAARLLKKYENDINGTIKLMFQSAEETFQGASDMIANHLLENPSVDAALMIHVMPASPFPAGTVIVSPPGVSAPAADCFEIEIKGKGCHGSMPESGIDPVIVASHIIIALQEISTRELSLNESNVLTIGQIHAGTASNVIPESLVMGGSIRTFNEDTREYIKKRIEEISSGISSSFRAVCKVTYKSGCPALVNDKELSAACAIYAKKLLGDNLVYALDNSSNKISGAGSEDFAHISAKVPSIMLALAAGSTDKGYTYPGHHPMVRFDEDALPYGTAIYAYMAMKWLEDN